jgi:hypothetical protein
MKAFEISQSMSAVFPIFEMHARDIVINSCDWVNKTGKAALS